MKDFTIHSLLYSQYEEKVYGVRKEFNFAKLMCSYDEHKFNRLGRVYFSDILIHQSFETNKKDYVIGRSRIVVGDETEQRKFDLTDNSTLIIGSLSDNDFLLRMYINTGEGGIPVALGFKSEGSCLIAADYKEFRCIQKLTEEDVMLVFNTIWNTPELLDIPDLYDICYPNGHRRKL